MNSTVLRLLACSLFLLNLSFQAPEKKPIDYADPFVGTDFYGLTFPGPGLPYAMVHASPDTHNQGWYYWGGYKYIDTNIMGFTHAHLMGRGRGVLLMPTVHPEIQFVPGDKNKPDEGYRSRFSHSSEAASPGYYRVRLEDYGVNVELTATRRVVMHRYTFPASEFSRILLDLSTATGPRFPASSELRIVDPSTIEGVQGKDRPGGTYFVIRLSKPCLYYGTFDAGYQSPETGAGVFPYKSGESGERIGAFLQFRTRVGEPILVKVALSYVSLEGARKNLEAELPHWDFDRVRQEASAAWSAELGRIRVEGDSEEDKAKFYTALYRSGLSQVIFQDVDGNYMGMDGKVHRMESGDFYPKFAAWDTFRTQHPLLTLIAPEHVNDTMRSIVEKVRQYGWLPAQHGGNMFGQGMIGDHLVPIIVDAYRKGFRDYDIQVLYEAMKKKATEFPPAPIPAGAARPGLKEYLSLGYMAVDKAAESVSGTLEFAYDDWCIAELARELGRTEDYQAFRKRAGNYAHLWDPETRFMRPRQADGRFLELAPGPDRILETRSAGGHTWYAFFDPLVIGRMPNRAYTESNAWPYLWAVPHDPAGLIRLMGGADRFNERLDEFFSLPPMEKGYKYVGTVGTIGQYVQGNQPSHHIAYLYCWSGQPWKTQAMVRRICDTLYRTGPGGLCGNEDSGSLSSWYIFSSLGFYPVAPGSNRYIIGSPLFREAAIRLDGGRTFTVKARNNSRENVYIQSATLNGKPYNRCWISHQEVAAGGELVFEMGPSPNRQWGTQPPPADQ